MTTANEWNAWIRRFQPAPACTLRLACFPHAGGAATFYAPWSAALSPAVEVLAVQYPGRQDRRTEKPIEDIHRLADRIFDVLAPRVDGPLALFGHSMGATIAFEVARRFERESETTPLILFVSGRTAPSRAGRETMHLLDDNELLAYLKSLDGTDGVLLGDDEMLQMILPAVRGDLRAVANYRCPPGPPLTCPIVALVGDSDPRTSIEDARAWREYTNGGFDLRVFDGGHFYLNENRAEIIDTVLTKTQLHHHR